MALWNSSVTWNSNALWSPSAVPPVASQRNAKTKRNTMQRAKYYPNTQGLRMEIIKAGSHDFRPEDFAQCSTLAFGFERSFARV